MTVCLFLVSCWWVEAWSGDKAGSSTCNVMIVPREDSETDSQCGQVVRAATSDTFDNNWIVKKTLVFAATL